jgi:hypothetical protein
MVTVVYDTNVVVSAALKPGSLPAALVALAMARRVRLVLSRAILDEYTAVLTRPKFDLDPRCRRGVPPRSSENGHVFGHVGTKKSGSAFATP